MIGRVKRLWLHVVCLPFSLFLGCVSIFVRHFLNGAGSFLAATVALSIGVYRAHRFLVLKKELQVTRQYQQRD
jgi:cytosine/uracil/thiamine/allantoin permease